MFVCKEIMQILCYNVTDTVISHFTQGPKLPAQSTTFCICKISLAPRCSESWESSPQQSHHRVASAAILPANSRRNSHAEASSSPASQPVVCSQYRVSNSKYACISYMHKMHQDAEISNSKYARICSTKYAENIHHCTNEIGNIYVLCASIYKNMQITIMHLYANIHICTNMHF